MGRIVLSGVQPTNQLTLGNYLGAIKNWLKWTKDASSQDDYYFMVVDLHAFTNRPEPENLNRQIREVYSTYISSGLPLESLFIQSHVPEHSQLSWILNGFAGMGELSRMTQFKDKSAKSGHINVGLFTYPLLMAADILLYDTTHVPVGEDQRQHVELTRDLAERVNGLLGSDTFVVPQSVIADVGAKINDLQNPTLKMSKSSPDPLGTVFLQDSPDTILKKFKKAVTDSETEIRYDPVSKPGVSNLLTIQAVLKDKQPHMVAEEYLGRPYGYLKLRQRTL